MISFWFPTVVYQDYIEGIDNDYLSQKAYALRDKYPDPKHDWYCNTYSTIMNYSYEEDNDFVVNKLIENCLLHVDKLGKKFNVSNKYKLECHGMWFNVASPGSYLETHVHQNSHFSLVYYVKTKDKCGNLLLRKLDHLSDMYPLPIDNTNVTNNPLTHSFVWYKPEDSMVIVFRSNVPHLVQVNKSNEDRISISMNFKYV
jgi:uncharacterized protein (TIGR02466 family)